MEAAAATTEHCQSTGPCSRGSVLTAAVRELRQRWPEYSRRPGLYRRLNTTLCQIACSVRQVGRVSARRVPQAPALPFARTRGRLQGGTPRMFEQGRRYGPTCRSRSDKAVPKKLSGRSTFGQALSAESPRRVPFGARLRFLSGRKNAGGAQRAGTSGALTTTGRWAGISSGVRSTYMMTMTRSPTIPRRAAGPLSSMMPVPRSPLMT